MPLIKKRTGEEICAPASKKAKKAYVLAEKIGYVEDQNHSLYRQLPNSSSDVSKVSPITKLVGRNIVSMLNSNGGIIAFGVRPSGGIYGEKINRHEEDKIKCLIDSAIFRIRPCVNNDQYRLTFTPVLGQHFDAQIEGRVEDLQVLEIRVASGDPNSLYEDQFGEAFVRKYSKRDNNFHIYGPLTPHEIKDITIAQIDAELKKRSPTGAASNSNALNLKTSSSSIIKTNTSTSKPHTATSSTGKTHISTSTCSSVVSSKVQASAAAENKKPSVPRREKKDLIRSAIANVMKNKLETTSSSGSDQEGPLSVVIDLTKDPKKTTPATRRTVARQALSSLTNSISVYLSGANQPAPSQNNQVDKPPRSASGTSKVISVEPKLNKVVPTTTDAKTTAKSSATVTSVEPKLNKVVPTTTDKTTAKSSATVTSLKPSKIRSVVSSVNTAKVKSPAKNKAKPKVETSKFQQVPSPAKNNTKVQTGTTNSVQTRSATAKHGSKLNRQDQRKVLPPPPPPPLFSVPSFPPHHHPPPYPIMAYPLPPLQGAQHIPGLYPQYQQPSTAHTYQYRNTGYYRQQQF